MKHDEQTAVVTGAHERQNRTALIARWLERCGTYIRNAANAHTVSWQATLLSRRKLTHPLEVTKMREPVRPTTRATWYR